MGGSPGQAGKEVPNLAMTVGFLELRRQCGYDGQISIESMELVSLKSTVKIIRHGFKE